MSAISAAAAHTFPQFSEFTEECMLQACRDNNQELVLEFLEYSPSFKSEEIAHYIIDHQLAEKLPPLSPARQQCVLELLSNSFGAAGVELWGSFSQPFKATEKLYMKLMGAALSEGNKRAQQVLHLAIKTAQDLFMAERAVFNNNAPQSIEPDSHAGTSPTHTYECVEGSSQVIKRSFNNDQELFLSVEQDSKPTTNPLFSQSYVADSYQVVLNPQEYVEGIGYLRV